MRQIRSNAVQILIESYREVEGCITLREYVELSADSEPGFFRWLFDDDGCGEYGVEMTEDDEEVYHTFLSELDYIVID